LTAGELVLFKVILRLTLYRHHQNCSRSGHSCQKSAELYHNLQQLSLTQLITSSDPHTVISEFWNSQNSFFVHLGCCIPACPKRSSRFALKLTQKRGNSTQETLTDWHAPQERSMDRGEEKRAGLMLMLTA